MISSSVTTRRARPGEILAAAGIILLAVLGMLTPALAADRPPSVPSPEPYILPTPPVRALPNGLQVIVLERHELPLVTVRLVIKAGAESDPPGAPGTAQLVAALLDEGTEHRTALQIAEAVDDAGGSEDTGAGWDGSYAEVSVLADHAETAFDVLADMATHPAFAPAELERQRRQILSALEVAHDDPGYLADTTLDRVLLAGTPYGHPQDGTVEAIGHITRDDLIAFHQRYFRPSNAALAIVGDISFHRAMELARKYFGPWPAGETPAAPRVKAKGPSERRIVVVDKPDAVQTEIRVGYLGAPRASDDYLALVVANQILGGPATNRLFSALRTRAGLTYGASSELAGFRTTGSWEAKTFTRTSETMRTLDIVLDQMNRLRNETLTDYEVGTVQSYLAGHLAMRMESPDGVASEVLKLFVQGLPWDYWSRYPARLRALTPDEVNDAVRRYLDPDRATIVLVGNAREFEKDLRHLGHVEVIPQARLDFGSPTLERPADHVGP